MIERIFGKTWIRDLFNTNHDRLGRFASGGANTVYAPDTGAGSGGGSNNTEIPANRYTVFTADDRDHKTRQSAEIALRVLKSRFKGAPESDKIRWEIKERTDQRSEKRYKAVGYMSLKDYAEMYPDKWREYGDAYSKRAVELPAMAGAA